MLCTYIAQITQKYARSIGLTLFRLLHCYALRFGIHSYASVSRIYHTIGDIAGRVRRISQLIHFN